MKIIFWTDGASRGNPGLGGWGVYAKVIHTDGKEKTFELSGGKPYTTNNRMELTASIQALRFLDMVVLNKYFLHKEKYGPTLEVIVHTDSKYVKTGVTEWVKNWEKNDWKSANKKPVLNKDLWQTLLTLKKTINAKLTKDGFPEIHWEYVKGHAGIEGNEMADRLATEAADKLKDKDQL